MADPNESILNMGQEMNPLGGLAGNQFGGDSVLGLQNSMPMPSTLNRVGAIIGGQEDPAVKQQAVNLQTMATVAHLKNQQQEMAIKKMDALPKVANFLLMAGMTMPDEAHRDNLAQAVSKTFGMDKDSIKSMMGNPSSLMALGSRYKYALEAGLTTQSEIMTAITGAHPELLSGLEKKNQLGAAISMDKKIVEAETKGMTIPKDPKSFNLFLTQLSGDPAIQYMLPDAFLESHGVLSGKSEAEIRKKSIENQLSADVIGSAERAKFNEYGITLPTNVNTWSQLKETSPEAATALREAVRKEKTDQKAFETNLALGKFRLEQDFKTPPPGTYLDKEGNPQLPPNTMGEVKTAGLTRLDPAQEKMWTAAGNLKTHNDLTMQYFEILSQSGIKPTAYLKAQLQLLNNNPKAKALFEQLGPLTSLAITNAVAAGTSMRGGVQMGEYVRPSVVIEGNTGEVAIEKAMNLNKIAISRLKDNGIPVPKDLKDQRVLLNALKEGKTLETLPDGTMTIGGGGQTNIPAIGEVRKGFRFKGGNPTNQNSWESIQ